MDRGCWWATVHEIAKGSDTTNHTCTHTGLSLILTESMEIKYLE